MLDRPDAGRPAPRIGEGGVDADRQNDGRCCDCCDGDTCGGPAIPDHASNPADQNQTARTQGEVSAAVRDLHDDGLRVSFTADIDGEPVAFVVDVPAGRPVVTDPMGRLLTESGVWVLPVAEVDGEWQPRSDNPADPWVREHQPRDVPAAVDAAVRGYLEARRGGP